MILFPAIDLKDGQCVRLQAGDMDAGDGLQRRPRRAGAQLRGQGFDWLHVVDLDGAFAGKPVNGEAVEAILDARRPIRCSSAAASATSRTIERWLEQGHRPRDPRHRGGARSAIWSARPRGLSRAGRRRHRRPRRQGRGRGLGRDVRARRDRARAALRGRGRRGDHLHRHRSRRRPGRHQLARDASSSPTR